MVTNQLATTSFYFFFFLFFLLSSLLGLACRPVCYVQILMDPIFAPNFKSKFFGLSNNILILYSICLLNEGYSTTLDPVVEEGMCEVMAYMWLEAELSSLSSSNVMSPYNKRKLGEFLKYQYESNTSPIHGDGFRQGQQAVSKYGLKRTLEHIRETENFPS